MNQEPTTGLIELGPTETPLPMNDDALKRKRKAESTQAARDGKLRKKSERESEINTLKAQAAELQLLKQQKISENVQKASEPIPESKVIEEDTDASDEPMKKKAKVIVADSNSESHSTPGFLSNVFSTDNLIRNGSVAALTLGAMYMKHVWKQPNVKKSVSEPKPEPVSVSLTQIPQQKQKTNQDFLGRPLKTPLSSFFKNVK